MDQSGRVYDELLVLHVQNGDRRALERLASRWHPRLRSARHFAGDDELARESVQESWLGIVAGLKKLGDPARFSVWTFTILRRPDQGQCRTPAALGRTDQGQCAGDFAAWRRPDGAALGLCQPARGPADRCYTLFRRTAQAGRDFRRDRRAIGHRQIAHLHRSQDTQDPFGRRRPMTDSMAGSALDADDEAFLKALDEGCNMFAQIGDTLSGAAGRSWCSRWPWCSASRSSTPSGSCSRAIPTANCSSGSRRHSRCSWRRGSSSSGSSNG